MDLQEILYKKAKAAKKAAEAMTMVSTETKNKALLAMADMLEQHADAIIDANRMDIDAAQAKGVRKSYIDRLMLNKDRIAGMADGLRQAAARPSRGRGLWHCST